MEAWHPWAAAAALATVVAARLWLRDAWARSRLAARRRRAQDGEREAEGLLHGAGFRVIDRQVERRLTYHLDGEPVVVRVRADLVVERGGRRFVAEVKTGARAPRLETTETRRQLLEYAMAFDVAGLLLVDADRRRVQAVRVPRREGSGRGAIALWLTLGVLVGAALTWAMAPALTGLR